MVKRLAEINLINRDEEAAMKYLRILSKQNFTVNGLKTESPKRKRLRQTMVKRKGHLFLKQIRYVPPQPMWSNHSGSYLQVTLKTKWHATTCFACTCWQKLACFY